VEPVSSAFTYQGRLEQSGIRVNDSCDFHFSLFDDPTAGSQVGSTQTVSSVPVSDGYFNVELNAANQFSNDAFNGEARYLEIEVQCSGDAGFVPLTGGTPKRVPLEATPYAHSLRPGADIYGSASGSSLGGAVLNVFNDADVSESAAVYAVSQSDDIASWGIPDSPVGVFGGSPSGYGVMGMSTKHTGVYGESEGGYGVYGSSQGGYAVYSDGPAHIAGELTWEPITGTISLSAAAFRPERDTMCFVNHGYRLADCSGTYHEYHASVQLPQGATIKDMSCYYNDDDVSHNFSCRLSRTPMEGTETSLITIESSGYPGDTSTTESCLANCQVDNMTYAYFLSWEFTSEGMYGYGVVINYFVSTPY
jgi:hypothetical protein